MKYYLLAGFLMVGLPAPAAAQWVAMSDDNPFADKESHLAISAKGGAVIGVKCTGSDVRLIFVVPEKGDDDLAAALTMVKPSIAVIVDTASKVTLEAEVDTVDIGGRDRLRLVSVASPEASSLAYVMAGARSRIAVAAQVLDKHIYPTTYQASGAKRAIGGVLTKCGVKPGS